MNCCGLFKTLRQLTYRLKKLIYLCNVEKNKQECLSALCRTVCICFTLVTHIGEIFIQLDSSHQYDRFEVQHAYVMIKIKEVMSNPIFFEFYYMFSF